jgi:arginine N-succinyltransferase
MLERQGFEYHGHIDPFDGGPYLEASIDAIPLVNATTSLRFGGATRAAKGVAIVSSDGDDGFRAVRTPYQLRDGEVRLPAIAIEALEITVGDALGFTPLTSPGGARTTKKTAAKKTSKKTTKKTGSKKSATKKATAARGRGGRR